MIHIGIDMHKRSSEVAAIDDAGKILARHTLYHDQREALKVFFARYSGREKGDATPISPAGQRELSGCARRSEGSVPFLPDHILRILRDIREKIGKSFGDTIEVSVEADNEKRVVAGPPDLRQALKASPAAGVSFKQLSYTHQREYARWIEEAKRVRTRKLRVEKTLLMLGLLGWAAGNTPDPAR